MPDDFARDVLTRLPLADAILSLWQWVADPDTLQSLFQRYAGACYQRTLTFETLVHLVADALVQHQGSGRQSFARHRQAGQMPVSDQAAYQKLGRLPVALSEGLLLALTQRMLAVAPPRRHVELPVSLQSFRTLVVDGKVVKRVPKRLKPLRGLKGGLLGGKALVALDLERGLALHLVGDPDGDANDARLIPALVPAVRAQRPDAVILWIADRQFADLKQTAAFVAGGHHFLVRYHPKTSFHADATRPACQGQDAAGRSWSEEWGWLGAATQPQRRSVRRITLERPGEEMIILITDLLDEVQYPANDLLTAYLARWGIERVFQKITEVFHLAALIGTTPQGTLFQLSFCLVLYNLIQVVRGYVAEAADRSVETISTELLFEDVRRELIAVTTVLSPEQILRGSPAPATAEALRVHLRRVLAQAWKPSWAKAPPQKRTLQHRSGKRKHSTVHRILQGHKKPPT